MYKDKDMKPLQKGSCYWRFKGRMSYHYGFASYIGHGLWRMGLWVGDLRHGKIVDAEDIDFKQ
jgi:hypothetical protein